MLHRITCYLGKLAISLQLFIPNHFDLPIIPVLHPKVPHPFHIPIGIADSHLSLFPIGMQAYTIPDLFPIKDTSVVQQSPIISECFHQLSIGHTVFVDTLEVYLTVLVIFYTVPTFFAFHEIALESALFALVM
jgi:hypothetical protein